MKIFLTILLAFASSHVSADVYKWTDNNGVMHFGDQPPQTTDKTVSAVTVVELSPIQVNNDGQVVNAQQKPQDSGKYIQVLTSRDADMASRRQAALSLLSQWQQHARLLLNNIQTKINAWRSPTSDNTTSGSTTNTATANSVEIYTAVWCGACKKARQWLKEKNIPFREYDVERDAGAALRMQKLGGGGGIPFAVINGSTIEGFSAYRYSSALH